MDLAFILGRITTADHGDIDPEIVFTEKHRALTGSESSMLHTARALAARGHAVTVYCWSRFEYANFDGLFYRHAELGVGINHDAYVSLSEPDLLRGAPVGRLRVCWQQQNTFSYTDAGYDEHVDTYVALSPKHRDHMIYATGTPPEKWAWIPNSIDLSPFDRTMARRPRSMAWLSSADRGLHVLLSMWPEIRKHNPDANLRIFYRFDEWMAQVYKQHQKNWNSARGAYINECLRRLGRDGENGITVVGAVSRPALIEELLQTEVVAYTFESNVFVEGFAVAALDACAAGCRLIVPDSDALGDIYDGIAEIIPGKPQLNPGAWHAAINRAFDHPVDEDARAWARNFDCNRVAELWEQVFTRNTAALPKSIRAFTRSVFDPVVVPPPAPAPAPAPAVTTGAPAVSVVVLLSRPGGIDITLAAMRDQTFKDFELILVDNRYEKRHDQLMALARAYGLKVIHVPEHRRNGKWIVAAAAFNTGFAIARGKYVLVLHDFAYVGPGWIESHLSRHTERKRLVVAHHQNVDLPELTRALPENMDTNRGSVEDDPAFAALDELRIFARGEFNASWLPLPISAKQWQPPFRTWFRTGNMPDRVWITLTNDSFERDFLLELGGVDERFDLCRATLDMDMGIRITNAGGGFVWNDDAAAEATLLNPRFVMRTKPFGQHHESVDGRWTERDAHDYNQIVQGRRAVRANNPYEIEALAARLESWRAPGVICVPSEVDDRTYYGGTIPVPEAPAIVHWTGPAPALDPYERAERDAYLEIRPPAPAPAPAPVDEPPPPPPPFFNFPRVDELGADHEPEVQRWITEQIKGGVFWDVGAHRGLMSKVAIAAGARHVVAIESNPRMVVELAERVHPPVTVVGGAVFSRAGLPFRLTIFSSFAGISRAAPMMLPEAPLAPRVSGPAELMTPTLTLDALLAADGVPAPDVIKIDVEGADFDVLVGATEALRGARAVIVEVNNNLHAFGRHEEQMHGLLRAAGFTVAAQNGDDFLYLRATPPAPRPLFTIIVPMCRPGGLDITFAGLRAQTFRDFEVIIVDNRYAERHAAVLAMAREYGLDVVHVPEHRRNGKWIASCAAFNTGFALARGKHVVVLCDYTYAPSTWLERIVPLLTADRLITLPFRAMELPPVKGMDPIDFSRVVDLTNVVDAMPAPVLDELAVFDDGRFDASWIPRCAPSTTRVNGQAWDDMRVRTIGPQPIDVHSIFMRNEVIPRELVFRVNGVDERYGKGRTLWDNDFAARVVHAGGKLIYDGSIPELLWFNPHWLMWTKPFGDLRVRVEDRWHDDDCRHYHLLQLQRRAVRAPNPFSLEQLARELAPWRNPATVCEPRDITDRAYFRFDVTPDSPTED